MAGTVTTPADKCTHWESVWPARVAELEPDVSIVQAGPWEAMDFEFGGTDGWHHLGDPETDERALGYLQEVIDGLSSTGARVAFLTTSHVDRRQPGPGPCECPERLDRWNQLLRDVVARNSEKASVIDLDAWLESLGPARTTGFVSTASTSVSPRPPRSPSAG